MDVSLPDHLAERATWRRAAGESIKGRFVVYWMHNALRAHENPALDVAICLARQNKLPLLVYHGLCETYPFASDRHHAFMLQGHRDVQRELSDRGIKNVFDFQSNDGRGPNLRELTQHAAVLVTDEMPVEPIRCWMKSLIEKTQTPIVSVDASCVVPVPLLGKHYERAFRFREATKNLYAQRVSQDYDEQPVDCEMFDKALTWESQSLQETCLASLIAKCIIDHSVAPIADTPGGTQAGYERWEQFKRSGLDRYAKKRNDAANHQGVSRLSAYLHYGMISPLRIAREADQLGASKFLDELLIWRELSFHFCAHFQGDLDSLDPLPAWASQTLKDHAGDVRDEFYSWETLARGATGTELWNLCQQSLLRHGELHNNLRMTWGKAFLPWVTDPVEALRLTLDLNHRYALDGRDPNSYGGILWCYGLFDRPFAPEEHIIGTLRPRPIDQHARRLDFARYRTVVQRPIAASVPRVAVVGAGLAGLFAARTLADHGVPVTVLDKSRGVSGRMATRRVNDELSFDHGAQYFTARDPRFVRYVDSWIKDGIVAQWDGRLVELGAGGAIAAQKEGVNRFVGVPGMNQIGKHLANDLDLQMEQAITSITPTGRQWCLQIDNGTTSDPFDVVIVNCPPIQSQAILEGHSDITQQIASVKMRPCWAMMLICDGLDGLDFDGAFINQGPLSWIARNSSKPGRTKSSASTWIIHASPDWSDEFVDCEPEEVKQKMLTALEFGVGRKVENVTHCVVHRWLYAIPANPLAAECLWDRDKKLGACGDWCGGPRVEGAFLSGMAMAGNVLRQITIDQAPYQPGAKMIQPSLL
ncbi:MAG: FAD-dependent oxidoreductase [Pirellulaceae bacterium]